MRFVFDEPLQSVDNAAVHVYHKVDTTWVPVDYILKQDKNNIRAYELFAEWRPSEKFLVRADSATFKGIYGGVSEKFSQEITFRSLDEYALLYLNIPHTGDKAIVQLLNKKDGVVKQERTKNSRCAFYFIKPGTYYLRLIMDENNNGVWDTGDFGKGIQPEQVYYYPHSLDLRALFEYTQDDWDIYSPLENQKPLEITKQKPDKERRKVNRNATRRFKK